jgi:preflagellin peptidase FlaK
MACATLRRSDLLEWSSLSLLPWALVAVVSLPPAVLDFLYRSVPEHLWYVGGKVVAVISFLIYLKIYPFRLLTMFYLESLAAPAAVGASVAMGLMGAGDLWASLAVSLMLPAPPPGSLMPPSLLVILLAAAMELVSRPLVTAATAAKLGLRARGLSMSVPCDMAHRVRWWFPEGASAVKEVPSESISRACQGGGEVRLQVGMPFVTFILIALPLALVLELTLFRVP